MGIDGAKMRWFALTLNLFDAVQESGGRKRTLARPNGL